MGWCCGRRRFNTVDDIPASYFEQERIIYGFCERVIDGDTIRVRHVPGYGSGLVRTPEPLQQRGIANVTLSIRIYGVDCPETGKNKRQTSQPFGDAATQFTTDLVYHKMVQIRLLRRDQYHRAVAVVETVPSGLAERLAGPQDVSLALAKAGLAELYTGGGAVYYNRRDVLEAAIADAQRRRVGIWSLAQRQSAADYKRAQKEAPPPVAARPTRPVKPSPAPPFVAVTELGNTRRGRAAVPATSSKRATTGPPASNNNKENLLDAVVTGLEFLG